MPQKKIRTLSVIGAMVSLLWLAACSPSAPTISPTLDQNPIRTEAAATVLAEVTRALALTPSATPLPNPTTTNRPTATPGLTASPSPSETATLSSGTPNAAIDNHAEWVSQSVADGTVLAPGQTFTMTWRLKNTGITTWTAAYKLRYYSGDTFGATKEVAIGQDVLPGGEIDINIAMKAPVNPGNYRSDWVMSSENLSNFKEPVYLKVKVVAPVTPTSTPKP
jgi:hypothetical protein